MKKLFLYIIVFLLLGSLGGFFTAPAIPVWYASLAKPSFNPPNYIFGPVWSVLYIMIGVYYWSISRIGTQGGKQLKVFFWLQFALNMLWTPVFFGLHSIAGGLIVILILDISVGTLLLLTYKYAKKSSLLLAPYFMWLLFATLLNFEIYLLN